MNKKLSKLESPQRLAELNPAQTLKIAGLGEHDVVADIGAGSGVFTIPAAEITTNKVYALDISTEMLNLIKEKANKEGLSNIELVHVMGDKYDICDQSVDIVLLVTVLHEIESKEVFLAEIKRIIKHSGKIAVIEFHPWQTPMGPPVEIRLSKRDVAELFSCIGLVVCEEFDMGENLYCLVFSYIG